MMRGSLNFLQLLFLVLLFFPTQCHGQADFLDLKAGFEENNASLQAAGLRVAFRCFFTESKEYLSLNSQNSSEEETAKYQPLSWGKHFEVLFDDNGQCVRRKIASGAVGLSIAQWKEEFPETLELFDNSTGPFDSYIRKTGSDQVVTVSMGLKGRPIKSFAISRMTLNTFVGRAPSAPNLFFDTDINSPFVFNFDPNCESFVPLCWVVFYWDADGIERSVEKLDNGNYQITIEQSPRYPHRYKGTFVGQKVVAEIAPKEGFLPTKVSLFQTREIDGKRVPDANLPNLFTGTFVNKKLDGLGFYCEKSVLNTYFDPSSTVMSREAFVAASKTPAVKENMMLYSTKLVEVQSILPWNSDANADFFSPVAPDDARFIDHTTGELYIRKDADKSLQLDLEKGLSPVDPSFRTKDSLGGNLLSDRRFLVVGLGLLLIAFGVLVFRYKNTST